MNIQHYSNEAINVVHTVHEMYMNISMRHYRKHDWR